MARLAHGSTRARRSDVPGSNRMCCTPRTTATVISTTLSINDTSGQPATGRSACPAGSSVALAGVRAEASGSLLRVDASA
eukprot:5714307-Pleurochrysis_carterae.AAC.1